MKKDNVTIYKRSDKVWPWGYFIRGIGNFVTDSEENARRQTKPKVVRKLRDQIK